MKSAVAPPACQTACGSVDASRRSSGRPRARSARRSRTAGRSRAAPTACVATLIPNRTPNAAMNQQPAPADDRSRPRYAPSANEARGHGDEAHRLAEQGPALVAGQRLLKGLRRRFYRVPLAMVEGAAPSPGIVCCSLGFLLSSGRRRVRLRSLDTGRGTRSARRAAPSEPVRRASGRCWEEPGSGPRLR